MNAVFDFLKRLLFPKADEQEEEKKVELPEIKIPTPEIDIPLVVVPDLNYRHPLQWIGVVLHHSANGDTPARNAAEIKVYHTSYRIDYEIVTLQEYKRRKKNGDGEVFQKPWDDIAYHLLAEKVEGKPILVPGRSLTRIGAHANVRGITNYFNERWIGFCVVGNHDKDDPDLQLWNLALAAVRGLSEKLGLRKGNVVGHAEVFERLGLPSDHGRSMKRTCPGKNWDMEKFRLDLL